MKNYKIKFGPILAVVAILGLVFGGRYAYTHGLLGPSTAGSAAVPVAAPLPEMQDSPSAPIGVSPLSLPTKTRASVPGPEIRFQEMAWQSQTGLNFANGGVLDDYVLTVRNAAADNIDSDGNPLTNVSHSVVVASGADLTVDFGFVSKKECDKGDKYGHDRDKYGHDRDDCDRDDDRCDKDDKYGGHDRDKYGRDDDCRDHDRDDDDRDRCKDDHWNDGWGRNDHDYNDGHDRDKGGWH